MPNKADETVGADRIFETNGGLTEKDRLGFAKQILFCLFLLVLLVFLGSYIIAACFSSNSELIKLVYSILDITKTAVPAIVTLVLGFYFGKST